MADFYLRQNDTLPSITATLKDGSGAIVDLTTATACKFHMRKVGSSVATTNAPAVIVTANAGAVRYDWLPADTLLTGTFYAEWEVTFGDGTIVTFPNDGYTEVLITEELA